jgi:lysozyme
MYLLRNDIKRIYKELKKEISFFNDLDAERQYALIDMAFNLGVFGLLRFKKMLKALEKSDYQTASRECLASKYASEVGQRAIRIAHTIATGEFKI